MAASYGHKDMAELLLNSGADVEAKTKVSHFALLHFPDIITRRYNVVRLAMCNHLFGFIRCFIHS